MIYNDNSHINSVDDVQAFFHHLVYERHVNFHPDNNFEDYVCYEDHNPTFTKDEVKMYNRLMDESFDVCSKENTDIYQIGCDELFCVYDI
jgi:hypothetical protein